MREATDIAYVSIEEAVDIDRARRAEAQIAAVPRAGRLILDLSEVPRFDFAAVIVLLDALARLRHRFGAISILGLSKRIGDVFMALRPPAVEWIYARSEARHWRN
jgi:anti-anti-sigma regulatory factor